MIVLYGLGSYAKKVINNYEIQSDEIECIVDKNCRKCISVLPSVKRMTWEEFLPAQNECRSRTIVLASPKFEEEMRSQIIDEEGRFDGWEILSLNEWIEREKGSDFERRKMDRLMAEAGEINPELLLESRVLTNRECVLPLLAQGMVAAEVGVACGGFSEKILQICKPRSFYAIDIFDDTTVGFWGSTEFRDNNMTHYEYYADKFRKYIDDGILNMERGLSVEVLKRFPDDFFDYLYLDAGHDYNNVHEDIKEVTRVVKEGGVIQFNDYIYYSYGENMYYGVMQAVNEMVNQTQSKVMYYCLSYNGYDDIVVRLNKRCL